jgi:hypothetical protein
MMRDLWYAAIDAARAGHLSADEPDVTGYAMTPASLPPTVLAVLDRFATEDRDTHAAAILLGKAMARVAERRFGRA